MSQIPPVPPSVPPQPAAHKKGLPVLAWVAIGCGGLLVIAILVVAAGGFFFFHKAKNILAHPETAIAQMLMANNPEVEIISMDADKGILTIRNKRTGEVLTVNFSDVEKGKIVFKGDKGNRMVIETTGEGQTTGISMKSDKGSFAFGEGAGVEAVSPAWIPSWPGVKIQSTFTGQEEGKRTGMYQFQLDEGVAAAMDYFEKEFKKGGFTPSKSTYDLGGQNPGGVLSVDAGGKNASVTFATNAKEKKTTVAVVYEEKE